MSESIRFFCTHCGKKLKAPEGYVGRQVQCTGCGAVQSVPEPETASVAAAVADNVAPGASEGGDDAGPIIERKRSAEDDGLDMTPMVDVTFLLLIFFMVTAAFSLQKSISIPTPDPSEAAQQTRSVEEFEKDDDYIVVRIDKDNTIWLEDHETPSEQELISQLKRAREGGKGTSTKGPGKLLVLASGECRHERVVMVLDAGTSAGIDEVRLANGDED